VYKTVQVILLCVIKLHSAASQFASMQLQCLARLLAPLAHAPRLLISTNSPCPNAPVLFAVLLWQVQFDENESCVFWNLLRSLGKVTHKTHTKQNYITKIYVVRGYFYVCAYLPWYPSRWPQAQRTETPP